MLNNLMLQYNEALILLARVLLMALFLVSGWKKLTNFSDGMDVSTYKGQGEPGGNGIVVPKWRFVATINHLNWRLHHEDYLRTAGHRHGYRQECVSASHRRS